MGAKTPDAEIGIRPGRPDDLEDLYRICLATGDSGADAAGLYDDPKLIGQIYAAPYALFSPECTLVAEDAAGLGGYILGALDTAAFEDLLEKRWWPPLRERYPEPKPAAGEAWSAEEIRRWQIHHPQRTPGRVCAAYPSHLHIDLLPRLQGRGVGKTMMDRWLAMVRGLGSRGVHLGVGEGNGRAVRFYRTYGWSEIDLGGPARHGVKWFGMPLTPASQPIGSEPHQPGR